MSDPTGPKKILIVDDEEGVVDVLARKLSLEGYEVMIATRGHEAVSKARRERPQLILMDILLPDIDGAGAVQMLQEAPETRDIPVIFLSGIVTSDSDKDPESSVKVGDHTYLAMGKPFRMPVLLQEMRKLLI